MSASTPRLSRATVKIDEYQLKVTAPNKGEVVLGVFVSAVPHPRINVGDRVENLIVDKSLLPSGSAVIVTCVHQSVLRARRQDILSHETGNGSAPLGMISTEAATQSVPLRRAPLSI